MKITDRHSLNAEIHNVMKNINAGISDKELNKEISYLDKAIHSLQSRMPSEDFAPEKSQINDLKRQISTETTENQTSVIKNVLASFYSVVRSMFP